MKLSVQQEAEVKLAHLQNDEVMISVLVSRVIKPLYSFNKTCIQCLCYV